MSRSEYVYLHGFASSPLSRKAQFFRQKLAGRGVEMAIPDLAEGDFGSLTVTSQLAVVDRVAASTGVTLFGSSLGGYLAALFAARHPERVSRLILMAPAFRLAERWEARIGAEATRSWEATGAMNYFHYGEKRDLALGWEFMADARRYEAYPVIPGRAVIFHGDGDEVVPLEDSLEIVARQPEVRLQVMHSDHELGNCLEEMWQQTASFLFPGASRAVV